MPLARRSARRRRAARARARRSRGRAAPARCRAARRRPAPPRRRSRRDRAAVCGLVTITRAAAASSAPLRSGQRRGVGGARARSRAPADDGPARPTAAAGDRADRRTPAGRGRRSPAGCRPAMPPAPRARPRSPRASTSGKRPASSWTSTVPAQRAQAIDDPAIVDVAAGPLVERARHDQMDGGAHPACSRVS